MRIIKLNAIDSTNSYLKKLCTTEPVSDYTAVIAENQTQGRGQMGTIWNSESSKNLTFSVFKELSDFQFEVPFYLSMVVALSLLKTLDALSIPRLSVKWPNDILAENKKIAGILIENTLKAEDKRDSVIGIGLNVNQIQFENLPAASSLSLLLKQNIDKEQLLTGLLSELENQLPLFLQSKTTFWQKYHSFLFKINTPMAFKNDERGTFMGIIKGVSQLGMLEVELEDEKTIEFAFKEVQMLY